MAGVYSGCNKRIVIIFCLSIAVDSLHFAHFAHFLFINLFDGCNFLLFSILTVVGYFSKEQNLVNVITTEEHVYVRVWGGSWGGGIIFLNTLWGIWLALFSDTKQHVSVVKKCRV